MQGTSLWEVEEEEGRSMEEECNPAGSPCPDLSRWTSHEHCSLSSTSWNGEDEIEDQWRWWAGQRLLQILHMNYEIDDGVGLEVRVVDLHKPAECLTAGSGNLDNVPFSNI